MPAQVDVTKSLRWNLDKGKVLPRGWDEGLTDAQLDQPKIAHLRSLASPQQWSIGRMIDQLSSPVSGREDEREHVEKSIGDSVASAARDPSMGEYDLHCFHERITAKHDDLNMKYSRNGNSRLSSVMYRTAQNFSEQAFGGDGGIRTLGTG